MDSADLSSVPRDIVKGTCHIKYIWGLIIGGFHTFDKSDTAIYIFVGVVTFIYVFVNNDSKLSKTYI